jgi:PH domain
MPFSSRSAGAAAVEEYDEAESYEGVDWRAASSTKSVPARACKLPDETINTGSRNAISLYDSDSSDEIRRKPSRSSVLIRLTDVDDDDNSVEDLMILSDSDDEGNFESNDTLSNLTRLEDEERTTIRTKHTAKTPVLSEIYPFSTSEEDSPVISSEKPPTATPWKRRSMQIPNAVYMLHKFRSNHETLSSSSNHDSETDRQPHKGSILFRSMAAAAHETLDPFLVSRDLKENWMEDSYLDLEENSDDDSEEDKEIAPYLKDSAWNADCQLEQWKDLSPIPNSFLGSGTLHPSMIPYFDENLVTNNSLSFQVVNSFAVEHSLLIRAVIQLLEERALRGLHHLQDDDVILKQGTLKKLSHSVARPTWKVKYAEVRKGTFSYYEDNADDSQQARKTIHLAKCVCQESHYRPGYHVFELLPENCPRRLFLCSSEEERQAWLRVIKEAKEDDDEDKVPIDFAPYQWSIDTFSTFRNKLQWSITSGEYLLHTRDLKRNRLQIPVSWLLGNSEKPLASGKEPVQKTNGKTSEFWKFLETIILHINGHEIPSNSLYGPERKIGALSRSILEYDHSSHEKHARHDLMDVQAVSYARDILMSCWQSCNSDIAQNTVHQICENVQLVEILPLAQEPKIIVNVSYANAESHCLTPIQSVTSHQVSGWVTTRSKTFRNWKNRFCVLSEGVLSYYEHAKPRPHGLRGQVVLVGAVLQILEEKSREDMHLQILQIFTKDNDRERQLSFRDTADFWKWKDAIQQAIELCTPTTNSSSPPGSPGFRRKFHRVIPAGRMMQKGMEEGGRIIAEGGFKVIKGASNLLEKITRKGTDDQKLLSPSEVSFSNYLPSTDTAPSVEVRVEFSKEFKIVALKDSSAKLSEVWLNVCAETSRTFHLSGGHKGRICPGDELIAINFL